MPVTIARIDLHVSQWLPGVWVLDLIMLGLIAEWLLLAVWHRTRATGPSPSDLAAGLAAGLLLMLALRLNLEQQLTGPTLLLLAGSGVLHLIDLMRRWPRVESARKEALSE